MYRLAVLLLVAFLFSACEQREQAQAPREQPGVASKEPAATQPAPGQVQTPATAPSATQPPSVAQQETPAATDKPSAGMQERPGEPREQPVRQQPGSEPQTAAKEQPATTQQPAGQSRDTAEFMGQAPKVEDAPEKIVLEAKNGNVTLPHRDHAGRMECKTCHGDAKPGKIEGFNKDKAHPLCQGCHKEKGAGPTKCADCHKKA